MAFVGTTLADPDDDTPRLIYADWLEERGDPRGEYVRLAVAIERLQQQPPGEDQRARPHPLCEIGRLTAQLKVSLPRVPFEWLARLHRGWIGQCGLWGIRDGPS